MSIIKNFLLFYLQTIINLEKLPDVLFNMLFTINKNQLLKILFHYYN